MQDYKKMTVTQTVSLGVYMLLASMFMFQANHGFVSIVPRVILPSIVLIASIIEFTLAFVVYKQRTK